MPRKTKIKTPTPNRPDFCTEAMLDFLDDLKESATINMYGAAPHLRDEFPELSKHESHIVLAHWRETYDIRHPEAVTAETAEQ